MHRELINFLRLETLSVSGMLEEWRTILKGHQNIMRDIECGYLDGTPGEVAHLHRATIKAAEIVERLEEIVADGDGDEVFRDYMERWGFRL